MHKISRRNMVISIVFTVLTVILGYYVWQYAKYVTPVKVGDTAPNIKAVTVKGHPFELDKLQGEPVFLNFFTPWCPPCIQETPDLIKFSEEYGRRIHVVMIDRGDDDVLVQQYVKKYHLPRSEAASPVLLLTSPYR